MEPMKVALLGAGDIAVKANGVLPNMHHLADKAVVTAIASPTEEKVKSVAQQFGIPRHFTSLDAMLDYGEFDAVINLTPITVHAESSLKILEAGKHLSTEKPVTSTVEEADRIEEAAANRGLHVVCASPSMLYPTRREARRLVAAGAVGRPCFVRARSSSSGPGSTYWPSDPTWFYQRGSGPMLDVGVYSVQEMIGILNRPVKRVFGFFGITDPTRTVAAGPLRGLEFPVTANDNNLTLLDFGDSLFGVIDGTFNGWASKSPRMEIFGREGVLNMWPALNETGGKQLELYRVDGDRDIRGWTDVEMGEFDGEQRHVNDLRRALLVEHIVDVVRGTRPNELGLDIARHTLEIMIEAERASDTGEAVELKTTFAPVDFDPAVKA